MKKLIVLTVILGLATVANAGLVSTNSVVTGGVTWSVAADQLVGVSDSVTANQGGYGVGDPTGGITVTGYSLPEDVPGQMNAGDLAGIADSTLWDGYDLSAGGSVVYQPIAGDWFVFDLSGTSGNIDIYDYDVSVYTPAGTLNIIPEPATIALLGLGGLLLRRRR